MVVASLFSSFGHYKFI
jgi:hypothetical protein